MKKTPKPSQGGTKQAATGAKMSNISIAALSVILLLSELNIQNSYASIAFSYLPTRSESEKSAQSQIKSSEVAMLTQELSQEYFPFKKTLLIQYGGQDGPLYDPNNHQIQIPYSFYIEALNYFLNHNDEKRYDRSAKQAAIDTLLHTILHEIGHAFVNEFDIAILGKEEDAVDNFAAIIILNHIESGADIVISAADMFAFESEDKPEYYEAGEYIDEHSFDLQRYFSTLCLVYGSDPETHSNLLEEIEQEYRADRRGFCVEQFNMKNRNWHRVLSSAL
jgi:hypothetical protein